jgi:hypothetical protein
VISKWEPAKFKAQLINELAANGEIVGKFVEEEARRRLLDIQEPDWGAGYRQEVVARLLTNTVEKEANAVVINVGVAVGPSGQHHGLYIELGSSTAPAHPFLRPAVFENGAQIVALLSGK